MRPVYLGKVLLRALLCGGLVVACLCLAAGPGLAREQAEEDAA